MSRLAPKRGEPSVSIQWRSSWAYSRKSPGSQLDADVHAERVGPVQDRPDGLGKLPGGLVRRHAAERPAAGDADVGGADVFGELQRSQDHCRAVGPVLRVRADQARLKVRLWRGVLPVAERTIAIDVADRQTGLLQCPHNRVDQGRVDVRRVGVGHIRQDLNAGEPGPPDAPKGIGQRMPRIGVGGKGELHWWHRRDSAGDGVNCKIGVRHALDADGRRQKAMLPRPVLRERAGVRVFAVRARPSP